MFRSLVVCVLFVGLEWFGRFLIRYILSRFRGMQRRQVASAQPQADDAMDTTTVKTRLATQPIDIPKRKFEVSRASHSVGSLAAEFFINNESLNFEMQQLLTRRNRRKFSPPPSGMK